MANFMICFLICNTFISGIIGLLLAAKRLIKNTLSSRMQYNLWFLLLGLLAVPFLPFRLAGLPELLAWSASLYSSPLPDAGMTVSEVTGENLNGSLNWVNDFTLSVNSRAPSAAGYIIAGIWVAGIFVMLLLVSRSTVRLHQLRQSALPLQIPKSADYIGNVCRSWKSQEKSLFTAPRI